MASVTIPPFHFLVNSQTFTSSSSTSHHHHLHLHLCNFVLQLCYAFSQCSPNPCFTMLLYALVLLVLAALGLSDMVSLSSSDPDSPNCTLTFTATQPPQIGPTTTIYKAIMTTFLYVSGALRFHHRPETDRIRLWIVTSALSPTPQVLISR